MKTGITIVSAKYVSGYKIKFTFSDGKVNVYDYENLVMSKLQECIPYRDKKEFKKFSIIRNKSEIAWGEHWYMHLPLHVIYSKTEYKRPGRKTISDKVRCLRVYVRNSVIEANGGDEKAISKCVDALQKTKK